MRKLKDYEKPLVETCFEIAGIEISKHLRVEPMDDGHMGSLLLIKDAIVSQFGIAECNFLDKDGVPVYVSLNATREGEPAELDVWKVDFSPLIRWPNRNQINIGVPD